MRALAGLVLIAVVWFGLSVSMNFAFGRSVSRVARQGDDPTSSPTVRNSHRAAGATDQARLKEPSTGGAHVTDTVEPALTLAERIVAFPVVVLDGPGAVAVETPAFDGRASAQAPLMARAPGVRAGYLGQRSSVGGGVRQAGSGGAARGRAPEAAGTPAESDAMVRLLGQRLASGAETVSEDRAAAGGSSGVPDGSGSGNDFGGGSSDSARVGPATGPNGGVSGGTTGATGTTATTGLTGATGATGGANAQTPKSSAATLGAAYETAPAAAKASGAYDDQAARSTDPARRSRGPRR